MAGKLVLFGQSALDYWRMEAGALQVEPGALAELHARPPRAHDSTYRHLCELASDLCIPFPLSLMCQESRDRRNSRLARFAVWRDAEAEKDVSWVADDLGVCKVPLALAQVAAKEGLVEALLAALEFCGTYLMAPAAAAGFVNTRSAVTSVDELRGWYAKRHAELPRSAGAFSEVIRYAQDGSNSPAESKVYALLSLGREWGGLGIPGIELNVRLELDGVARRILGARTMRPDFYLPAARIAGEYKSKRFHPESSWTNDDRRMDALVAEGLTSFSLNNERVRNLKELSSIGQMIAKRLRLRRSAPTPEQLKTRRALHVQLFNAIEFDADDPPDEVYDECAQRRDDAA